VDPLNGLPSSTPLTADQQAALKKLHDAATQLEGVFAGMLFKEMHKTVPDDGGIFGKKSNAEDRENRIVRHREDGRTAAPGPGLGLPRDGPDLARLA
jgi:hypothetical protein